MISRVVDHCFWFGRYLERAESTSRLLQATRAMVFDGDLPVNNCWEPLVIVAGEEEPFIKRHEHNGFGNGELVQDYLTWSRESSVSLASSVRAARECARAIRDQLSLDAWEEINELYLWLGRESTQSLYRESRDDFYRGVRKSTQLTMGLVRSTMLHEEPMSFLWLGAMLERAGQTGRILDMHHHTMEREAAHDIVQTALWMSLLRACSGAEAFMKKNRGGRVTAQSMISFLVFEPTFPRSIRYCLKSTEGLLQRIWPEPTPSRSATRELLNWLTAQAEALEIGTTHQLLTHCVDQTANICSMVSQEIQGPRPSKEPAAPQKQTQSQSSGNA